VPIPTYYGDEICHVNGIAYAFHCLATILRSLANRVHLVYHPKFDLARDATQYRFKKAPTSLHQFVLGQKLPRNLQILELGAGSGDVGLALYKRGGKVCAVDLKRPDRSFPYLYIEQDLNEAFAEPVLRQMGRSAGIVVALDVLEHLNEPEKSIRELRETLSPGGILLASTGNVAYAPLRLGLLLGQFNYGKKGILDLTHRRLFTIRSFCRTLEGEGFEIRKVRGFGPPIQDMVGDSLVWRILDRCSGFLAWIWPSLFSYQFIVEAVRLDDIDDILARTVRDERVSGRASESETPRRRAGG
ncbi:MAG: class I SAM-dependent methyltransferase, partial [Planctomycetota bacterium]